MLSQWRFGPSGPGPQPPAPALVGWDLQGAPTSFPLSGDGAERVALWVLETPTFSTAVCLRMALPPFPGPACGALCLLGSVPIAGGPAGVPEAGMCCTPAGLRPPLPLPFPCTLRAVGGPQGSRGFCICTTARTPSPQAEADPG